MLTLSSHTDPSHNTVVLKSCSIVSAANINPDEQTLAQY